MMPGMPRTARIVIPNFPHHVVHRGHNRQRIFWNDDDYLMYLAHLAELKVKCRCKVYGFCLMSNHVHLILDPGDTATNLARLMKHLAGRYTRYINRMRKRTGTLWEGRFKSSVIDRDAYLLCCSRYVDLNPQRAGITQRPDDYRWSSLQHKIGPARLDWLDIDPCYRGLGRTERERHDGYRKWVGCGCVDQEWRRIHEAVNRGHLTGDGSFINKVAKLIGRRIEPRAPGRPIKPKAGSASKRLKKTRRRLARHK